MSNKRFITRYVSLVFCLFHDGCFYLLCALPLLESEYAGSHATALFHRRIEYHQYHYADDAAEDGYY